MIFFIDTLAGKRICWLLKDNGRGQLADPVHEGYLKCLWWDQ